MKSVRLLAPFCETTVPKKGSFARCPQLCTTPGVAPPSSTPETAHAELAFNVPPGVPLPFGPPLPLPVISPANAAPPPAPTTAAAHAATAKKRGLITTSHEGRRPDGAG